MKKIENVGGDVERQQPTTDQGLSQKTPNTMLDEETILYKLWEKNIPSLYSLFFENQLSNKTKTVQWLPETIGNADDDFALSQIMHGSCNLDGKENYLYLSNLCFPNEEHVWPDVRNVRQKGKDSVARAIERSAHMDAERWLDKSGEMTNIYKMKHEYPISIARLMPNYPDTVCTQSSDSPDLLMRRFPSIDVNMFTEIEDKTPLVRFKGHKMGGCAIEWNFNNNLLSGADDGTICYWDALATPKPEGYMEPSQTWTLNGERTRVTDCGIHQLNEAIFGVTSSDGNLSLFDVRGMRMVSQVNAHTRSATCLAFNPFAEYYILSGGAETDGGLIKLWDIRKLTHPLYEFEYHRGEIIRLEWDSMSETIFAASATDKRMTIWDASLMGSERSEKLHSSASKNNTAAPDAAKSSCKEIAPELIFIHGGFQFADCYDFSFHPHNPWILIAVADELLQCFGVPTKAHSLQHN